MKRILRIINLQDRFRKLAILMISIFIGSPIIMFGNSTVNHKDSRTIKTKSQIATGLGFSIENDNNEPYTISKGSTENGKELAIANEEDALPANRNDDDNTVTFVVFNQDGLPVPDAMIVLSDGISAMTDEFGFASLPLLGPLGETYQAEISKPFHETLTLEFINEGEDLFFEVLLIEFPPDSIQITCPPEVIATASGTCNAFDIDLGEPTIQDNSPSYVVTNDTPPDGFPVGTTVVIWTVVNEFGETASCDQLVTVVDSEPPVITDLPNLIIDNDAGDCGAGASWDAPSASDNCEVQSIEGSHAPGDFFPVGSTPVIYTATDVHGNPSYSGFTVEVIDVEPPIITPTPDITIDNEAGECGGTASWDPPTASDNCEGGTLEASHAPGDFFPVGQTSVVYTATDVHGNPSYSGFTVEVIDVEPPIITPTPDIAIDNEAGECGGTASWDPPTASDNCEGGTLEASHAPGDFFPVGQTSVVYTATDVHGNPAYAGFTVEVIDVEPPTITDLPDITVDNDAGECGASASWDPPTASDNCEGGTIEGSHMPGDFFPVGSTSVIYTATDVHGNPAYAGFTVQVIDVEPPIVTPIPEITVQLDALGNASIVASDVDDGSNDACGIADLSVSPSTFTCTDVGANTVTLTVTDNNGNTNVGTATVTVEDNILPVAFCQGITIQLDGSGNGSIVATDIDNGSNDACGIADLSVNPSSFTCSDLGENSVTLTVTDNNGNTSTCGATVTVEGECGEEDCLGVPGGTAYEDDCGVCDDNPDNDNTTCAANVEAVMNASAICNPKNVSIHVYDPGTSTLVETLNTTVDVNGNFAFEVTISDSYDIYIKVDGYLRAVYPNVALNTGPNDLGSLSFTAGDINNDNSINIPDFSAFSAAYGSSGGDPSYNELADFNCNNQIEISDFSLLSANYGSSGVDLPIQAVE